MSNKHYVTTRRPSWSSELAGQGQYGHYPSKSLHGSSDWSLASEPFPDFDKQDHGVEGSAHVVTLTPSDLETSTSYASKHPVKQYLSSSPCTSDNTNMSDNEMSSQCSSSFDLSAMAVLHSEMKWQYIGQVNKKKEHEVSAANRAPPEILSQIYAMLSPRDFDNARRTCSQWMRASLQQKLLENMLKRAGWWDAWRRDCQTYRPVDGIEESIVWRLSKRFATESVLSGRKVNVEQTGFLPTGVVDFGQLSRESLPKESPGLSRDMFTGTAPRLTAALRDPAFSRSVKFSVSTCGHYVLAATGCMIYVYYLGGIKRADSSLARFAEGIPDDLALSDGELDILPVSSIGCPYEVLSATIDTSTPRFVIAALLRGRIGMICDIKGVPIHPPNEQTSVLPRRPSTRDNIPAEHAKKMEEFRDAIASSAVIEPTATSNSRPPMGPRTVSTRRTMNRLTRAPRKYFHDVCSVEDPPRSVSICPGRRCIAFGCGSGIELHWVDEKTQEDSRKMFPLSQPAEVLHFLPSRVEIDEVSKLRLISSLAGPGASGCQCHRAANGEDVICQFHLSSRVNSLPHWTPRRNGHLSLVKATHCHHYRAMPVNDGLHILFIEPVTGYLCIGSDAPIGGPTNLTRAMICIPPSDHKLQSDEDRIPTIFAVGSDLSRGLRIVAAYQDRIVLYTVPVDVYNVLRRERQLQGDGVMGDSDLARDWFLDNERNSKRRGSLAQNQNGDWEFLLRVSYRPTAALWPLKIYGKEIGRMAKIVDFSVQTSSGGVRVWAFGASGEARIFDIDTHTSKTRPIMDVPIKALNIASDGSIGSAAFVDRAESGLLSPLPTKATRKRKHLSQPAAFDRSLLGLGNLRNLTPSNSDNDRLTCDSTNTTSSPASSRQATGTGTNGWSDRRQSFAACIMDLRIPELGMRNGQWMETERASTVPTAPSCGLETTMFDNGGVEFADFHDVASYDPQEIRKFYTVWSTSSSKPTAGRWR